MSPPAPYILGLTGSVGMGKSTTAGFFRDQGVPVWDADAAVHRLYTPGGGAVAAVTALCPDAADGQGGIDRTALKRRIAVEPALLDRIEAIVHPLLRADRAGFLARAARDGAALVVFDIPLLFETGTEREVDATLIVSAPPEVQRARVLARPGMDAAQFESILARQMPDAEKRRRADHVMITRTSESVAAEVRALIDKLKQGRA